MEFSIFCLPIFFKFRPSWTIWMNSVKHTTQKDSQWYRQLSQNRSGGRFLNTSGPQNVRDFFFQISTFLDNLEESKLLGGCFRVGMVQISYQNKLWRSIFDHFGSSKSMFSQKVTFLKRIVQNRSDNPTT